MRCFLATFRPLTKSLRGRRAAEQFGLPSFIDGSCRREPDFESAFPSITATCRAGQFAPRLRVGDRVAYLTVKARYPGDAEAGWRFVALLRVIGRFSSHEAAAEWYLQRGLPLPSNCLVHGNAPKPLELTNAMPPCDNTDCVVVEDDPINTIESWDAIYHSRVGMWPVFLVCEPEFLELFAPPQVCESEMKKVFGRKPGTQTPPEITCEQLNRLLGVASRGTP